MDLCLQTLLHKQILPCLKYYPLYIRIPAILPVSFLEYLISHNSVPNFNNHSSFSTDTHWAMSKLTGQQQQFISTKYFIIRSHFPSCAQDSNRLKVPTELPLNRIFPGTFYSDFKDNRAKIKTKYRESHFW